MISAIPSWCPPPKILMLGSDEVHVWRAALDLEAARLHSLRHTLSAEEQARAERFYFDKDRKQFVAAHGLLRAILAQYLKIEPSQLQYCYNPLGKPSLARTPGREALRFNMSHSHGLALYAVSCGRELGVDLERIRWQMSRLPSDSSRLERSSRFAHSLQTCGKKVFLLAGPARRLSQRPGVKALPSAWTSSTYHWFRESRRPC